MDGLPSRVPQFLPQEEAPTGRALYLGTWTGRIIFFNTIIFLLMSYVGKTILMPSEAVLLQFGAKDPVSVAQGQWWRLISPVFVHIGVIHFLFNSYALRSIGTQIEKFLGPRWFLGIYLIAGIFGNIASAVFNVNLSAGASGAIFGLIGCGLVIETSMRKQLARNHSPYRINQTYTSLAVLNLILGFIIPGIDNAAHLGGLLAGSTLTVALLRLRPNWLVSRRPSVAYGILLASIGICVAMIYFGTNKSIVTQRLVSQGDRGFEQFSSTDTQGEMLEGARSAFHFYSRALDLNPNFHDLYFKRGRLLILAGDVSAGLDDLSHAGNNPELLAQIASLMENLKSQGRESDADRIVQALANRLLPSP